MKNQERDGQIPLFETTGANGKKSSAPDRPKDAARGAAEKKKIKVIDPRRAAKGSGQVPEGDVRLTANVREDLHLRLKIAAAKRRTTIGELIEELVQRHL